ncbi:GDP-L-fucose synthase [Actinokineospora sp. NBRC 105648]|uniref:GDP-L-fucose synthase family protein n=1 Tax=Actinokineospora sp. NBRC 105648 TaxID=3032206 RepID=UPI0024A424EE|nr:GDP-L-fucose synthase [Actinokineospora sp. NBRC 105648]GLZ41877.1 GDP-L-fucose synthase [Actinokineospora sp. NBRC 105648]
MRAPEFTRSAKIFVAGHRGLVGSALVRRLRATGHHDLVLATSSEVDLRDRGATARFLLDRRPEVIVLAAARVGGIAANAAAPADFLSDNLRIQLSVLDAARALGVPRVLFLGSSCIYPREARQPIKESALLTGPLEPTNAAYAIAKIAGITHVRSVREQDGLPWITAMPTNLYGPGDNFHPTGSHVLPGLMRRFHEAAQSGAHSVTVWGTGTPRREFLHADDLADACLTLLAGYDGPDPVNVGTGRDITIADLARLVAETAGYTGRIEFDPSKPDGTPRKVLDISTLTGLGWEPRIRLREGVAATYAWYLESLDLPRQRGEVRGHEVVR